MAKGYLLQGLHGVHWYMDYMIITGKTTEEHLNNLEQLLRGLYRHALRANVQKIDCLKDRIELCGHVIDSEGLHKTTEKVSVVLNAPVPKNFSELRTFLGLVNYYGCFI